MTTRRKRRIKRGALHVRKEVMPGGLGYRVLLPIVRKGEMM